MADPLSPLVEPPLAPPPPMDELRQRARRIQRRRWAVKGTGATAVVVALVAGAVSLTGSEPRTTVRVAGPGPTTGVTAGAAPATASAPRDVVLDRFEAGGKTWHLVGTEENGGICLLVKSGDELANGLCWPITARLAVTAADVGGGSYMFGITSPDVTLLTYDGGQPVPFVGPNPSLFSAKIFGMHLPATLESVTVTAATATDAQAYSQPVTLPLHRRVASINGQPSPPTTNTVNQPGTVPPQPPVTEPAPTTTVPRTAPSTTAPPPLGGQPKRVQPNPGATNLRPTRFEFAAPSNGSLLVRFWGGNENCDVLGRVDVEETATTVTIRLWTGWPPGYTGGPCTAEALQKDVVVPLDAPVAGRTIIDGNA